MNSQENNESKDESVLNGNLKKGMLPKDAELRVQLLRNKKILISISWIIFAMCIVWLVIDWFNFDFIKSLLLLIFLISSQAIRLYGKYLQKRAESRVSAYSVRQLKKYKEEQEQVVLDFMNNNPAIAEKIVKMRDLNKQGKKKDAIAIINSLLKRNLPKAIELFLRNKKEELSR